MARTSLDTAKTIPPGHYPTAGVTLVETAADPTLKEQMTIGTRTILLAHNTDDVDHTITINSVSDPQNRLGDITDEVIPAGVIKIYGPFAESGWKQEDGYLYLEADDASIKFSVIVVQ